MTGAGEDRIWGNDYDNQINTSAGDDIINAGGGSDDIWGGSGADIFIFETDLNDPDFDTIHDFEIGIDRIDLDDTRVDDFAELRDQRATQDGSDTIIDTGAGHIRLVGIELSSLQESDFIF